MSECAGSWVKHPHWGGHELYESKAYRVRLSMTGMKSVAGVCVSPYRRHFARHTKYDMRMEEGAWLTLTPFLIDPVINDDFKDWDIDIPTSS